MRSRLQRRHQPWWRRSVGRVIAPRVVQSLESTALWFQTSGLSLGLDNKTTFFHSLVLQINLNLTLFHGHFVLWRHHQKIQLHLQGNLIKHSVLMRLKFYNNFTDVNTWIIVFMVIPSGVINLFLTQFSLKGNNLARTHPVTAEENEPLSLFSLCWEHKDISSLVKLWP